MICDTSAFSGTLRSSRVGDCITVVMLRTHDQALWNGNDTSLSTSTTTQYYGATGQITAGGQVTTAQTTDSIVDIIKAQIATMMANSGYEVRPTAIYVNPVLADLIDKEIKTALRVQLGL